jgi:YD repeat-containing protein
MKKELFESLIAAIRLGLAFIIQSTKKAGLRTVSIILITALLLPLLLFNPIWQTQAQTRSNLSIRQAAPVSAPPEPFIVGSAQSTVSLSIISSLSSVKDYFSTPPLPEGFEIVKVPTTGERIASSLGKTFGSIFGVSSSSSTKEVNPSISSNLSSSNAAQTNLQCGQSSGAVDFDFDGDGCADIARWHASNTEYKIKKSSDGNYQTVSLGSSSSVVTPGDFDGDGKTDAAVFNAGTWTIKKSSTNTTLTVSFGTSGDKPVVGDYDGDGKSDPAVFRPSTNTWWVLYSSTANYSSTSFGSSGDIPVQGEFDGDGITDMALFRPSTGDWHVQGSTSGYYSVHWGNSSDIPVPADYTGDGKTDLAVYRGATGIWYVLNSDDYSSYQSQGWGNYGDQPVPADYDGDGKADYSVWRPTTGVWYTIKSYDSSYDYQTLGVSGDTAVPSAYLKQIGGLVYSYDFAKIRLSPKNATGGTDLYSRNFSWGTSLVGLPGRSGLDTGFGISYNSLVWTKDTVNNAIVFDADNSNVTPGFRMGFPTIEPVYYDSQTGKFAYLMVTPSGSRVEFRQTAASTVYETADSSYTQLKINDNGTPDSSADSLTLTVTNTGGTNMLYEWKNGAYRCQRITDRNGNYITINHDTDGKLQTVTDTLGRVVTVNYTTDGYPNTITQTWKDNNGQGPGNITRTYATFTYSTQAITTNFRDSVTTNPIPVIGPGDGYTIKVLQKITFPTETTGAGPSTVFEYNSYGQVKKINNYAADNHLLNYVSTNLDTPPTSPSDCPRFTETRNWVEDFNQNQAVVVSNSEPASDTYNLPDGHTGTAAKIVVSMTGDPNSHQSITYVGSSGWMEGLPIVTEDWANGTSGSERKRWTWTSWTQDDTNLAYIQNPRVTMSKVGDTGNIKRTETDYRLIPNSATISEYGLVTEVRLFDDNTNILQKKVTTDYNLDSAYLSRRMVNLPSSVKVTGYDQLAEQLKLVSFVTYVYDEGNFSDSSLEQNISSVIQHDANFGSSFITGRGNLTSTTRCDATYSLSCTNGITSSVKYNIAGAVVAQIDPLGRTVKIGYGDNFNDTSTTRYTYAYPTRLTELAYTGENNDNNYSLIKYRFDTGANVWAKSPKPAGNSTGKETTRLYDAVGRLERETLVNSGAYTRYEYPTNNIQSKVYSTVVDTGTAGVDVNDEVYSEGWTDGAGRVRKSRTEHPDSTGGWTGTLTEYDILGQVKRSTVPTEVNPSYEPSGDDATRGWLWTSQEYDWKGRVTRSIPSDSNGSDGKDQLISYDGCGCAGGQVTTIQGELVPRDDQTNMNARRTQKIYEDILGRTYKTEVLDWGGSNAYTTTVQTFNGRDQVVNTRQYAGTTGSSTYQDVSMTYDGHGRMKTRHHPIEDTNAETTWNYNADDSIQSVIDPRNVITDFTYDNRGLLTDIKYTLPSNSSIPDSPDVLFFYDALGNRTQMTDGLGTVAYTYNNLSQLTSETRDFTDTLSAEPTNHYKIQYTYNLSGRLKSVTDPFDNVVEYTNDKTGRLTAVKGTQFGENNGQYIDNIKYRAFGKLKQMTYNTDDDNVISMQYDTRLRPAQHQVTSSIESSGFIQKAEFSYYADSSPQAMDNQLNSLFDHNQSGFHQALESRRWTIS